MAHEGKEVAEEQINEPNGGFGGGQGGLDGKSDGSILSRVTLNRSHGKCGIGLQTQMQQIFGIK